MIHLIDEFKERFERRGAPLPGKLKVNGLISDLIWDAESFRHVLSAELDDPGFTIEGYTRWLAFARIGVEIRYYAGPLPPGDDCDWRREDPSEARLEAVRKEAAVRERGVLKDVDDAAALAESYLAGVPLRNISVERAYRRLCR